MINFDRCQIKVSADQYHLTIPRAQIRAHRDNAFFEVDRCFVFICSQAQALFEHFILAYMKHLYENHPVACWPPANRKYLFVIFGK